MHESIVLCCSLFEGNYEALFCVACSGTYGSSNNEL